MRARRMRDYDVERSQVDGANIALEMIASRFAREKVTGPRVMPSRGEGVADGP